ncbi:predicted protein [Nematostella vectensis]|uniref:Protein RD3 n=1 Tax=Nematostella vectensis TaxID=45351 RepID=A7SJ68_NEMVE|nr:uncharacterized protein LOC5507675 [Nematostella vectensis]EDO36221.1 predicted protein [Nematostella vectensis]|eukprot:XP_001628284.1 predicted protein [Nematostella vectensis]
MSLSNFGLKKRPTEAPYSKPDYILVCETILCELEGQIKSLEDRQQEMEKEEKRKACIADYSWLISSPERKSFQIPPAQRLTLEDLAAKVRPEDSSEILSQFRKVLESQKLVPRDLPQIMQCVIERYLSERKDSDSDTTMQWISRSVSGIGSSFKTLRSHSSSKVYPGLIASEEIICDSTSDGDDRTKRSKSLPEFVAMKNLPV